MNSFKRGIKVIKCRLWAIFSFYRLHPLENVYHGTVQKAGSQWVKKIFSDPRISKISGLKTFPQHRYDVNEFKNVFPKFSFVPGLYLPYYQYQEIKKPRNYKSFYVLRDPRNIVVSWYYSMLKSHGIMGNVLMHRNRLKELSFDDGIFYCINYLSPRFAGMRTWVDAKDSDVLILKFEELIENPQAMFSNLFEHLGIDINSELLLQVLESHSKDNMRAQSIKNRGSEDKSHYRKSGSNFNNELNESQLAYFNEVNGNLLEVLGYE